MSLNCAQLTDIAPELALGVVTGQQRADAFAHLDACSSCRQLVSSLSVATDELLRAIAPSVEPPAGFTDRVLDAIAPAPVALSARRRQANRWVSMAAAACIALLVGLVALVHSPGMAFAAAQMRTDQGEIVGWVYVDRQDSTIAMKLPGWVDQVERWGGAGGGYSLRITGKAGDTHTVPVKLTGAATWQASNDAARDAASLALVDDSGHVWCHAALD
jgi:hypothetical protein